jgi:hypothetical protein
MNHDEKRQHPRKDVFTAALIVAGDDGYLSEVWDLSIGGAKLGMPKQFPSTAARSVRVFFMIDQDTVIALNAEIVRIMPDHLGVRFAEGQRERTKTLLYETQFLDSESG